MLQNSANECEYTSSTSFSCWSCLHRVYHLNQHVGVGDIIINWISLASSLLSIYTYINIGSDCQECAVCRMIVNLVQPAGDDGQAKCTRKAQRCAFMQYTRGLCVAIPIFYKLVYVNVRNSSIL